MLYGTAGRGGITGESPLGLKSSMAAPSLRTPIDVVGITLRASSCGQRVKSSSTSTHFDAPVLPHHLRKPRASSAARLIER